VKKAFNKSRLSFIIGITRSRWRLFENIHPLRRDCASSQSSFPASHPTRAMPVVTAHCHEAKRNSNICCTRALFTQDRQHWFIWL